MTKTKTAPLPQTSKQISDAADRASVRGFAKQGLAPYDWAADEPDIESNSNDNLLPAIKSDQDFLREFFNETGLPADQSAGRVAVGNVVYVNFTDKSSPEQKIHIRNA